LYSKDEASQLKQTFWTAFGQYIAPQLSAEGKKINWVNYKTGVKHLFFKMHADKRSAFIAIEMSHPDQGIRELMFEQFQSLKNILKSQVQEEWEWDLHTLDDNGKTVGRIYRELDHISIFKQEDWPALISFFKPRIIALDAFWSDAQYSFDIFK
jgi:Zn-dependent oligopeptidase